MQLAPFGHGDVSTFLGSILDRMNSFFLSGLDANDTIFDQFPDPSRKDYTLNPYPLD